MSTKRNMGQNEIVVRAADGSLEVVDLLTGEVVSNSAKAEIDDSLYVFRYEMALLICQEVKNGRTLLDIGSDPNFPPLHVISHWQRTERMFAQELILARRARAEVYHDKVMEIADNAAALRYGSKEEIAAVKLAADQYKWAAERGDSEKYGNKVTHEGSTEKPITMRVINTGIQRTKPDIETEVVEAQIKEIDDGREEGQESEDQASEDAGSKRE